MYNFAADVHAFVTANFLLEPDALQDEDSFLDTGIIDSTGILELVAYLEENYGIEITDSELNPENLDSVTRIASYLQRKLSVPAREAPVTTVLSLA